jgi:hypothetical protein
MIKLKIMKIANYFNFDFHYKKEFVWTFCVIIDHNVKLFGDSAMKLKRIYK